MRNWRAVLAVCGVGFVVGAVVLLVPMDAQDQADNKLIGLVTFPPLLVALWLLMYAAIQALVEGARGERPTYTVQCADAPHHLWPRFCDRCNAQGHVAFVCEVHGVALCYFCGLQHMTRECNLLLRAPRETNVATR